MPNEKRAFIEYVRVDLRETNALLSRVAEALEVIVLEQYGHVSTVKPIARADDSSIDYTDEREGLKQELLDIERGAPTDAPVEG